MSRFPMFKIRHTNSTDRQTDFFSLFFQLLGTYTADNLMSNCDTNREIMTILDETAMMIALLKI